MLCRDNTEYLKTYLKSNFMRARFVFMIIGRYKFTTKFFNLEYLTSKLLHGLSVANLILKQKIKKLEFFLWKKDQQKNIQMPPNNAFHVDFSLCLPVSDIVRI
jgi:hypothetical protein